MFDFATLEAYVAEQRPDIDSDKKLAELFGVSRSTVARWRDRGHLDTWTADRVCVRAFGEPPIFVWPDWASSSRVLAEYRTRNRIR